MSEVQDQRCAVCPFCGENDFDAIGLKIHLIRYCEEYAKLPSHWWKRCVPKCDILDI
jgi:hypothetical protein